MAHIISNRTLSTGQTATSSFSDSDDQSRVVLSVMKAEPRSVTRLTLFDSQGTVIRTALVDGEVGTGIREIELDNTNGQFTVEVTVASGKATVSVAQKLILMYIIR